MSVQIVTRQEAKQRKPKGFCVYTKDGTVWTRKTTLGGVRREISAPVGMTRTLEALGSYLKARGCVLVVS